MIQPIVIEHVVDSEEDVTREDGGKAFIVNVYSDVGILASLISYEEEDAEEGHIRIRELVGKKVRVTVEVIEE
jgi:hypothetical protein